MSIKKPRKNGSVKRTGSKSASELAALYAEYRRKFSAADLQKYTEIEPMVPFDQTIAEVKRLDREMTAKTKKHALRKRASLSSS